MLLPVANLGQLSILAEYGLSAIFFVGFAAIMFFIPAALVPADAYTQLVRGNVRKVEVKELNGKVSAVMVVPYPPGIPVIMPGEKFTPKTKRILDYLAYCEDSDTKFPGFESEVHGVMVEKGKYYIYCVK